MIATVKETGAVAASAVRVASSFFSRFMGLMFRFGLTEGEALHIVPCSDIHMFFMFMPLDALFLDRNGTVLRIRERLLPYTLAFGPKGTYSVLEMKSGAARRIGLRVGQKIEFST